MPTKITFLALASMAALMLSSCQQIKNAQPTPPPENTVQGGGWWKEKRRIFEAVKSCSMKPDAAIAELSAQRAALASSMKVGFNPETIRSLAREGGCQGI